MTFVIAGQGHGPSGRPARDTGSQVGRPGTRALRSAGWGHGPSGLPARGTGPQVGWLGTRALRSAGQGHGPSGPAVGTRALRSAGWGHGPSGPAVGTRALRSAGWGHGPSGRPPGDTGPQVRQWGTQALRSASRGHGPSGLPGFQGGIRRWREGWGLWPLMTFSWQWQPGAQALRSPSQGHGPSGQPARDTGPQVGRPGTRALRSVGRPGTRALRSVGRGHGPSGRSTGRGHGPLGRPGVSGRDTKVKGGVVVTTFDDLQLAVAVAGSARTGRPSKAAPPPHTHGHVEGVRQGVPIPLPLNPKYSWFACSGNPPSGLAGASLWCGETERKETASVSWLHYPSGGALWLAESITNQHPRCPT